MQNPITAITDKVMRMVKSMVFLALQVGHRSGATTTEIVSFLNDWAPPADGEYHTGIVERVLEDLLHDGKVAQAGARWYLRGAHA